MTDITPEASEGHELTRLRQFRDELAKLVPDAYLGEPEDRILAWVRDLTRLAEPYAEALRGWEERDSLDRHVTVQHPTELTERDALVDAAWQLAPPPEYVPDLVCANPSCGRIYTPDEGDDEIFCSEECRREEADLHGTDVANGFEGRS